MHQLLPDIPCRREPNRRSRILFAIVGIRDGYFADSSPEVIDIAKIFFHTKHEGRNKDSIRTEEEFIVVAGIRSRRTSVLNSRYRNRHSS